jgi:hypothetical protein
MAAFRGQKTAILIFLSLFEDPVPKHDEYHQGDCEYNHGLKI